MVLNARDRELVEALDFDPNAPGVGNHYEDEVPADISREGWELLLDLIRYRILLYGGRADEDYAEPYRRVWSDATESGLKWNGFRRQTPPWAQD